MSYGDSDPFNSGCVNALRSFQDAYRYAGARIVDMVYGSAEEPGDRFARLIVTTCDSSSADSLSKTGDSKSR